MLPFSKLQELNKVFYPDSVAVVGASSNEQREKISWTGWLLDLGFKGKIYPINPRATQILGLKAFPSVKDVPGPLDYAIIALSSALVPSILQECVDKGVKTVHILASGFAETGRAEGIRLQKEIERIIRNTSTRVIGPNCLGVYCPASGLGFGGMMIGADASKEPGSVGVVSHSGAGVDGIIIPGALVRGIRFSKVVSCGNCVDLSTEDFLEYLAEDNETQFVFCYIEGIKDGRRFFRVVKKCMQLKPIIILKGGITAGGARAAASHTAALAGSEQVWEALFEQTGVLTVNSFEEAVDQLMALVKIMPIQGPRIAIVGRGGGPGVAATDICERAGLSVPQLAKETRDKLAKMLPPGSALDNPVEVGVTGYGGLSEQYEDALSLTAHDPNIDMILIRINVEVAYRTVEIGDKQIEELVKIWVKAAKTLPKPLAISLDRGEYWGPIHLAYKIRDACSRAGLASFPSLESATRAIAKAIRYYEFKRSLST